MRRSLAALLVLPLMSAAAAAQAPPAPPLEAANPRAMEPFERDWVLMDWALRNHDRDGDVRLSLPEAQAAAKALKEIADGDRDGRVTTYEFERAREFILARY